MTRKKYFFLFVAIRIFNISIDNTLTAMETEPLQCRDLMIPYTEIPLSQPPFPTTTVLEDTHLPNIETNNIKKSCTDKGEYSEKVKKVKNHQLIRDDRILSGCKIKFESQKNFLEQLGFWYVDYIAAFMGKESASFLKDLASTSKNTLRTVAMINDSYYKAIHPVSHLKDIEGKMSRIKNFLQERLQEFDSEYATDITALDELDSQYFFVVTEKLQRIIYFETGMTKFLGLYYGDKSEYWIRKGSNPAKIVKLMHDQKKSLLELELTLAHYEQFGSQLMNTYDQDVKKVINQRKYK